MLASSTGNIVAAVCPYRNQLKARFSIWVNMNESRNVEMIWPISHFSFLSRVSPPTLEPIKPQLFRFDPTDVQVDRSMRRSRSDVDPTEAHSLVRRHTKKPVTFNT